MSRFKIYEPGNNSILSIAVFLSGSGTNFDALYNKQLELERVGRSNASIDIVFSNFPGCEGIQKAKDRNIKTVEFSSKKYFESIGQPVDNPEAREAYDKEVLKMVYDVCIPDIIVLAGYRRKLSGFLYNEFENRIINMYPGDITKDYLVTGVPATLQALKNREKEIKCSVYIDIKDKRFGPAIAQSAPIPLDGFNEKSIDKLDKELREKAEWMVYPFVIYDLISNGRVSIDEQNNIFLDNKKLPDNGLQL